MLGAATEMSSGIGHYSSTRLYNNSLQWKAFLPPILSPYINSRSRVIIRLLLCNQALQVLHVGALLLQLFLEPDPAEKAQQTALSVQAYNTLAVCLTLTALHGLSAEYACSSDPTSGLQAGAHHY